MQETRFAPHAITDAEWSELAQVERIKELFSLEGTQADGELLASICYGSRFDYINGSPGYFGDLFVLVGDHMDGPYMFTRGKGGQLAPANEDPYLKLAAEAGYQERIRQVKVRAHTNERWYPYAEFRSFYMLSAGILLQSPMAGDGSKSLAHAAVDWERGVAQVLRPRMLQVVEELERLP